jgi:hypothetical protein
VLERAPPAEADRWKFGDSVTLRGRRTETRLAQPRSATSARDSDPLTR